MNTTENNKLIAEFLHGKNAVHPNQYHENWNELMQVVEKIESLNVIVEIRENVCYIETSPNNYTSELELTKIQAVYKACIEFVKWYNQQNK